MTTLGTLTLELSAPTANLAADLKRASEMVRQTAQQWQVKPVWGIAASLQDEMRASRSIFNDYGKGIESDAKGYQPKIRVGVEIDRAGISRELADLSQEFSTHVLELKVAGAEGIKKQIKDLNQQRVVTKVDDSQLTALNDHLTLKERHLNRVVSKFASTPIKPVIDDKALTELNRHLTAKERHLERVVGKFASTPIVPAVDLTNLDLLDRRLDGTVDRLHRTQAAFNQPIIARVDDRQLLSLEDALDRVEKPHKLRLDLPDTIGKLTSDISKLVLSPITIPVKLAQNAITSLFTGAFEGIGRDLSKNFSKGFSGSIEQFITKKTGSSTGEMGTAAGKYTATRTKIGAEYISQELGYRDGLRGVGNDLRAAGTSIDTVLRNPRRAAKKLENKIVQGLEYYYEGDTEKAMNVATETFAPMGKLYRRAAGVGIRAAAQPIRMRNRAMLKGKVAEAEELAKNIEIEGYDRESAEKADAIHIVTGGLDFNNGENAHFAGGLLKQQYPKAHTITHVNQTMNQPVERGQGVVGGLMGMMEQLQQLGGKKGKIGDMPIQKLAEMAIDLGYNPDGLEMFAKAVKIRQAHPDKPINFMGTSGGVNAVDYAVALSERAGMKNVKGVGLGLPMTGLTELASKQNFQSIVGTLDDLDIAYHNEDHLGAKRLADPVAMAKIREMKSEKLPFDVSGIVSVGKTQKHIIDAGAGHAIGNTYLANDKVIAAMNSFIARPGEPTPHIRSDIQDPLSLNNFYADKFNAKRKEIPLTIAALYKDPKALARIEADPIGKTGDYTYFSPENKNHEDDWLRLTEFEGLIKDVRGEDIQGRSAEENAKSRKKGLNKFIEERRKKAAKKGTKSVVAEHAAGWLDYLDLMKSGMEEYGSMGKMPYDALQKGAEYYPELRPLAAREQHKQHILSNPAFAPQGVEHGHKYIDKLYASGDINKINELRSNQQLNPIDNKYGYKDALATPDWYLKDLEQQQQKVKQQPVVIIPQPDLPIVDYHPFAGSEQVIKTRRAARKKVGTVADPWTLDTAPKPPAPIDPGSGTNQQPPNKLDASVKFAAAVDKFDLAVDRFSSIPLYNNDFRPPVDFHRQPEPVEVNALQTLAADTARATGKLAVQGAGATAKWLQNPVSEAIQATAGEIGKTYRAVERAEELAFRILPGASTVKKTVANVAAPMGIAYAAAQNPAVGGIINGAMGMAGGSIGLIGHGLVDGAASLMPWGAKDLFQGIGNGTVDLASTYGPALYGGKFALNAGKEVLKKAFPGFLGKEGNRKDLDSAEIQAMMAGVQAELQALKNFQTLTRPDVPKVTAAQDLAAQQVIADHTREQEQQLNHKFNRLDESTQPTNQKIDTNIKSIDVGDTTAIQSEVQRISAAIQSNRKSIVKKLKSNDPEEIAQGLLEAGAFGHGLNILRGDLQATRNKIAPAKITNPSGSKKLESSRKSIDGFLSSPGAQTTPVQEAVSKIAGDSNLTNRVIPYLPANSRSNIFDFIKSALIPKPSHNNNDGGYTLLGGIIGQLAVGFKRFAESPLGQKRVPGLDFLDYPVKSFSETIGLTHRESDRVNWMFPDRPYTPPATKLQRFIANTKQQLTPAKDYITEYPANAKDNFDRIANPVKQYLALGKDKFNQTKDKTQNIRENPVEEIRAGIILAESETRKVAKILSDRLKANWQDITNPIKQQIDRVKQLTSNTVQTIGANTQNLRDNPAEEIRAGLILAESESRKKAAKTWQESRGKDYLDRSKSFATTTWEESRGKDYLDRSKAFINDPNTQTIVESFKQDPIGTTKTGLIVAESKARRAIPKLIDKAKSYAATTWEESRGKDYLDRSKSFATTTWEESRGKDYLDRSKAFINDPNTQTIIESFKQDPIQTTKIGLIVAESKARRAIPKLIDKAKSYAATTWEESRGKDYLDRSKAFIEDPNTQQVVKDFKANPIKAIGTAIRNFTQLKNTQPTPPQNPLTPPAEIEKTGSALTQLTSIAKLALGAFGGYTIASLAIPAMIGLGKATLDTAANFETLQVKLAAASDSAQTGKLTFARLTGEADKLGISRSSLLETGAFIGGTTFGTELEGKPTERMVSQIAQIAQARGLNKQQTDGLNLALAQTLGRSRTSMQEINQLTQSAGITDARVIAAKGLGYTPAQFSAIQDSPTGVDSKRFVNAFLTQGVQDSLSAKDLAQNSIGFKQTKLDAGVERLQGGIGGNAVVSGTFKAGLDLLTGSIELLSLGVEKASNFLIGLGIRLLYVGSTALLPIILNSKLGQIAVNGLNSSFTLLKASIASMAVEMALFAVLGETIKQIASSWTNSSQDIEDAAKKIGKSIEEVNGKKIDTKDKPMTVDQIGGRDWGDTAKLSAQRANQKAARAIANGFSPFTGKKDTDYADEDFGLDGKQIEQQDRTIAVDKVLTNSTISMGLVDGAVKQAEELNVIDLEINQLDTQRSGLYNGGEPDANKLAALNTQYNSKYQERDKLTSDITPTRTAIQETINGLKGTKAKLDSDYNDGQIAVPHYELAIALVADKLQDAEQLQRKLNDAIKSGFDNLLPWTTTLTKIANKFEDIGIAANSSREKMSIARNQGEISGKLTKGGAERQATIDNDRIIEAEIKQKKSTLKELRAALDIKDPNNVKNVQKAYGLTDASSLADIKLAATNTTNAKDKITLENLQIIKEGQLKIATLDAGLSNSHKETFERIFAENREAMLYYVSLSQQIDPTGKAFNKAISAMTSEKNRFMAKLNNYGTGGFDVFTNAVIELMDIAKDRMNALAKKAADDKAAIDAYINSALEGQGKRYNQFNTDGTNVTGAANAATPDRPTTPVKPTIGSATPVKVNANSVNPTTQSSVTSKIGQSGSWLDNSDAARLRILQDNLADHQRVLADTESGNALKEIIGVQKVKRDFRLGQQNADKLARDQVLNQLQATPAISIQQTQSRETLSQKNSLIDNRVGLNNSRLDMADSVHNTIESIKYLSTKQKRTPTEDAILKSSKQGLPTLQADLKRLEGLFKGLDRSDAAAISQLKEQQQYALIVSKEKEQQEGRSRERTAISGKNATIEGQLKLAPLDQNLLKQQRDLTKKSALLDAEITRVDAVRAITDRARQDKSYLPKDQAKDKQKSQTAYETAINNASNKQSQDSIVAANTVQAETAANQIAELKLAQSGGDLALKDQQSKDKIDAPFANTKAIELEYGQKLKSIENIKQERDQKFIAERAKYNGTSAFNTKMLASIDRQEIEANQQSKTEIGLVGNDRSIALQGNERERSGYLFTQNMGQKRQSLELMGLQNQTYKQRGQDTRETDFSIAVQTKQLEYGQKRFDLEQQRKAITGLTPQADAARAAIDGMIGGLDRMQQIDITNLTNGFDRWNELLGKIQDTTKTVLGDWMKNGRLDWKKILVSGFQNASDQLLNKLVPDLFASLYRKSESTVNPNTQGFRTKDGALGIVGNILGFGGGKTAAAGFGGTVNGLGVSLNEPIIGDVPAFQPAPSIPNIEQPPQPAPQSFQPLNGLLKVLAPENVPSIPKPEPFTIPPAPKSQYEGVSIRTLLPHGYIDLPAEEPPKPSENSGFDIRPLPMPNRRSANPTAELISMGLPLLTKLFGFAEGGVIGSGRSKADDQLILAQRGEGIITHRGMDLLGTHGLNALNVGQLPKFATGGVVGELRPIPMNLDQSRIDSSSSNNVSMNIDNRGQVHGTGNGKELIEGLRHVVTQELIRHKRANTGLI